MTMTIAQIRKRLKYADALREAAASLIFFEQDGKCRERVCICGARVDRREEFMPHVPGCVQRDLLEQAGFIEFALVGCEVAA
jgi:hypothetical protein